MSRRTLPLIFTAFLMLTGFLLPALRVAACMTSTSGTGCPMKMASTAKAIAVPKSERKHGCCREKSPVAESKVITGTCCCTIKAAAKPFTGDYRTAFNIVDLVFSSDERLTLDGPFVIAAPGTKHRVVDVRIARGPPRGAAPHRGPPTLA